MTELDPARRRARLAKGESLRQAIKGGIASKGITISAAARMAGMRSPSALFNFLNYLSNGLAYPTTVALSKALGFNLNDLASEDLPPLDELEQLAAKASEIDAPPELHAIIDRLRELAAAQAIGASTALSAEMLADELLTVKINVDGGGLREIIALPPAMQEPLAGRLSSRDVGRRAFGVRVIGKAGSPVYQAGTVLICVPASEPENTIAAGRRVLVCIRKASTSQGQWKRFKVELREVAGDPLELRPLGVDQDARPVAFSGTASSAPWTDAGFDIKIYGVVIDAIINEEGIRP